MKHTMFTLLVLVLLTGAAGAQNMLTNPGFESGTTGWTGCPDSRLGCAFHAPNAHSGADALCAEGCCGAWSNQTGGIQGVALNPAQTYDISGWAKGCAGPLARVGYGGGCGSAPVTVLGSESSCIYTQYAGTITGAASVDFYFHGDAHPGWSAASVHFDDAYVALQSVDDWVLY